MVDDIANDILRRIIAALFPAGFQIVSDSNRPIVGDECFAEILFIGVADDVSRHGAEAGLIELVNQRQQDIIAELRLVSFAGSE